MHKTRNVIGMLAALGMCAAILAGCQAGADPLNKSNIRDVAKLATLECTYHSVAQLNRDADKFIIPNVLNVGQKHMWFEYDATVKVGVDASKVSIAKPDGNGQVVITMPQAQILTEPDIDVDSMTDPLVDNGFLTDISDKERKDALNKAQTKIKEKAESDDALKLQARERAKTLLSQYVKNVGQAVGRTYTVEFRDGK